MNKPYKGVIEEWSVTATNDPYLAPEQRGTHAQGKLSGRYITTSRIISVKKKRITTENSIYDLGVPSEKYVEWMKENNIPFDPENPIRIVEKLTVVS